MTGKFRQVADAFWVSPQITLQDVSDAAAAGFKLIINNRPDGEAFGQPESADLEAAAEKAGLAYAHIPVGPRGLTPDHIAAHRDVRRKHPGKAVAFCRSGARSVFLHACAAASEGVSIDDIIKTAAAAGYDVSAHRSALDALAPPSQENDA